MVYLLLMVLLLLLSASYAFCGTPFYAPPNVCRVNTVTGVGFGGSTTGGFTAPR